MKKIIFFHKLKGCFLLMSCNPKISVIIPVYNEEKYLSDCIESIIHQSLEDIEIIFIDDGSTDKSLDILKKYEMQDDRLSVLEQKNLFAGNARNSGLEKARGEYLIFLDADDFFEVDMLEKMYSEAKQKKLDIVICEYSVIDQEKNHFDTEHTFLPDLEVFSPYSIRDNAIFQLVTGVAWNKLFRKTFIDKLGISFQNLRCSNDGYFVYIALMCAKRITYIKEQLVHYRANNMFSLSGTREKSWINAFQMLTSIKNKMVELHIYYDFEKSFLNYALTHSIGYLASINSREIFGECYNYFREVEHQIFHILDKHCSYFYKEDYYECYKNVCKTQVDSFLDSATLGKHLMSPYLQFWSNDYKEASKIIIYGAGRVGNSLYKRLLEDNFFANVLLMDRRYKKLRKNGIEVLDPDILPELDIDYIFVAIRDRNTLVKVLGWIDGLKLEDIKVYHM